MNILKVVVKSILICLLILIEPLWELNFPEKLTSKKPLCECVAKSKKMLKIVNL